jgi:biopolymer transport protein ExbB/biopolymer transport protein TolQ
MVLQMQVWALNLMLSGGPVSFDPADMWAQMGWLAKLVVIALFIMSAWSIGVMIDRLIAFNAARTESRKFAPAVAGALREGKLDEAIKIADRYKAFPPNSRAKPLMLPAALSNALRRSSPPN